MLPLTSLRVSPSPARRLPRTVLITGALGHIGSALVPYLFTHNYRVLVVDNFSTQRYATLLHWSKLGIQVGFTAGDVRDAPLMANLISRADVVVHLAAVTDASTSHEISEIVYDVNTRGTAVAIAELCADLGKPLIFPSTTSVYGVYDGVADEDSVLRPQSPYAFSKLNAEVLLRLTPISELTTILRFGTIYGPSVGMRFHTAVQKWEIEAVLGRPMVIWTDAYDQKRPYLYLGDACSAIGHVLAHELFGETYNVVSGNHTPHEVTDIIKRHRPDARVEFVNHPLLNQYSYTVSGEKFNGTGFQPQGTIQSGIAETMDALAGIRSIT